MERRWGGGAVFWTESIHSCRERRGKRNCYTLPRSVCFHTLSQGIAGGRRPTRCITHFCGNFYLCGGIGHACFGKEDRDAAVGVAIKALQRSLREDVCLKIDDVEANLLYVFSLLLGTAATCDCPEVSPLTQEHVVRSQGRRGCKTDSWSTLIVVSRLDGWRSLVGSRPCLWEVERLCGWERRGVCGWGGGDQP